MITRGRRVVLTHQFLHELKPPKKKSPYHIPPYNKGQLFKLATNNINDNEGQSNLVVVGINENWQFRPPNLPFLLGTGVLNNTVLLGTT